MPSATCYHFYCFLIAITVGAVSAISVAAVSAVATVADHCSVDQSCSELLML